MQCRDAQEALGAMIDGEVSAIDEAAREHVSNCMLCAQRSEEYRDIGAKLWAVAHQTLPPGLEDRVRARLRQLALAPGHARAFGWRKRPHWSSWLGYRALSAGSSEKAAHATPYSNAIS
jgi:hypothetical protein